MDSKPTYVCGFPGCPVCTAQEPKVPGTPRGWTPMQWTYPELDKVTGQYIYVAKSARFYALTPSGVIEFPSNKSAVQPKPAPSEDDKAAHRAMSRSHKAFNRHNTMGWTPDWDE